MIEVVLEEMHGSDRDGRPELISGEPLVGMAKPFQESEMALFSECMEQCRKKSA